MPKMQRPPLARLRLVAVAALGVALAGCVAMQQPKLGPGPPVIAPTKVLTLGAAPVKGADVTFAVSTVTSIPGEFAIALDESLKRYAATRKVNIVSQDSPSATYRVSGYISAIGDTNRVMLVYVWDVFDGNGNRLHRFSGQEPAGMGGADPWTAVTTKVIDDAARQTVDALADWVRA